MNTLEVFDYTWYSSTNNLKKQARICVGVGSRMKPALMDINTSTGVGPAISGLDCLGIARSDLEPSIYTTITLKRGNKLYDLPVLGQVDIKIHHARGRIFRCRTGIKLDRDAKSFNLKTQVIEKFPKVCQYEILAGHDFLKENELRLDDKNAQLVSLRSFPAKTVIQYMHPDQKYYLRSHTVFWQRHYKPPEENKVKIVLPNSCDNCGTKFRQLKKNENFIGKYKKGEMILLHGEIDHFPCTLGLTVRSYSNNHIIKAVHKKARSKMVLSVPECAVRRKEEDESTVIPEKYNNSKKTFYPAIVTKVGSVTVKGNDKVDASTQTKNDKYLQRKKKRTFSKIRSEFSECLYPFTLVEDWVNDCPSNCSDISQSEAASRPSNAQNKTTPKSPLSIKMPNSNNSDDDYVAPDNYMNIPEQHRMVTFPARCFKLSQDDVLGNPRAKTEDIPDDVHEFLLATEDIPDDYNRMVVHSDRIVKFHDDVGTPDDLNRSHVNAPYSDDVYEFLLATGDIPDDYNHMVVLPDQTVKYHKNAKQEDILGNAGGGEEPRQSMYKTFRPAHDDDITGYS